VSAPAARPRFVDPHIHMTSRTADDAARMAAAGIRAVIEPAFWLGQPRTRAGTFEDYFAALLGWERFRASQFGIRHHCALGLNAKEANDEALAAEVLELLPLYAGKEGVVAVGEIGFDDQTPAEERAYRAQLDLAREADLPVMVHTPHRDKRRGTARSMDLAIEHGLAPSRVIIDHNNEETVAEVLARGFWAAFTIYPRTKMGSRRMVEVVRKHGSERVIVDSSADWGLSDPLAVPKTARLMRECGIPERDIERVTFGNAMEAYGLAEADFLDGPADPGAAWSGNTVTRGQDPGALGAPMDPDEIV
jgi:predicted metal-dependent TIM-barrel fold hydrolase